MKLINIVLFGRRPLSGKVITQVMAEFVYSYISIRKPSRKQSNVFIFTTENRMSKCTNFKNTVYSENFAIILFSGKALKDI